jgi:prepilin-type N-terminal cleavage/methylation domain-containing protein
MKPRQPAQGFTLVEILVVVALIGIVALAAIPLVSSNEPAKLVAAATEVGNGLRYAISEAQRTGGYVLVDASSPGQLKLRASNAAGADLGPLNDPLTKQAMVVDTSGGAVFGQVGMEPRFFKGGTAYSQLLVGPGTLQAFEGGVNRGVLEAGSAVVLAVGSHSVTLALNETTGRVTIPSGGP